MQRHHLEGQEGVLPQDHRRREDIRPRQRPFGACGAAFRRQARTARAQGVLRRRHDHTPYRTLGPGHPRLQQRRHHVGRQDRGDRTEHRHPYRVHHRPCGLGARPFLRSEDSHRSSRTRQRRRAPRYRFRGRHPALLRRHDPRAHEGPRHHREGDARKARYLGLIICLP